MLNKLFNNKYRTEVILCLCVLIFILINCTIMSVRASHNQSLQRYESDIQISKLITTPIISKNWNSELCKNFSNILTENICQKSLFNSFFNKQTIIGDENTANSLFFNMEKQFLSDIKTIMAVKNYKANIKAESTVIQSENIQQKSYKNLWGLVWIFTDKSNNNIQQSLEEKTTYQQQIQAYTQKINIKEINNSFNKFKNDFNKSSDINTKVQILVNIGEFLNGEKWQGSQSIRYVLKAQSNQQRSILAINLVKFGAVIWVVWLTFLLCSLYLIRLFSTNIMKTYSAVIMGLCINLLLLKLIIGISPFSFIQIVLFIAVTFILALISRLKIKKLEVNLSSGIFVPFFVLFLSIGWLLIVDLSLNFNISHRFLLVESFYAINWSFILLAITPLFMPIILYYANKFSGFIFTPINNPYKFKALIIALLTLIGLVIFSKLDKHVQSKSGEILKVILVFLFSWFLMIRGNFLLLNRLDNPKLAFKRIMPILGFLVFCLIYALISKDFGPLLLTLICAIFWIIPIMVSSAKFLSVNISILLIFALFFIIIILGKYNIAPNIIVERVNIITNPFNAVNDDVARLLWFQQESPLAGFGLGYVPWCGYADDIRCIRGLPLQLQSDYTFTGLIGLYGIFAMLIVLAMIFWVWRIISNYYQYPIKPLNMISSGYEKYKAFQICIAMTFGTLVIVQLCISASGNLAWVPLTGITMPFISFGSTALMTYSFISGIIIHNIKLS